MEAKGCARPASWKDARRLFYWATRARLAQTTALAQLEEASPDMTNEQYLAILFSLAHLDEKADNRTSAEALEALDLKPTLTQLRSEHLARRLLETRMDDRKAVLNNLVRLVDNLSAEEKALLLNALQNSDRLPGMSICL
jgi:acetyl-CoA carboxylase / biotin carboxylase 1